MNPGEVMPGSGTTEERSSPWTVYFMSFLELNMEGSATTQIIIKQSEIIESLAKLNNTLIGLLSNYMDIEEYEGKLKAIMSGDDVIV